MQQLSRVCISFLRSKVWHRKGMLAMVATMLIVSGFFIGSSVASVAVIVTVTPVTGGSVISADTVGGSFTILTGPTIRESAVRDVGLGTIILTAPSGFIFDITSDITATVTNGSCTGGNTPVLLNGFSSQTVTPTPTTATVTVTQQSTGSAGCHATITYTGIKVRPTAGNPLVSGDITKSGTSVIVGVTDGATNFGTLVEIAGNLQTLVVTPAGATINVDQTATFTATGADQFGNSLGDITGSTNFTISAGAGGSFTSAIYHPHTVGTWTVTGTNGSIIGTTGLTVNPGAVSASQSTLIWNNPGVINTDGGTATFTVTAKDQYGNIIPNSTVVLASTGSNNSYDPISVLTDSLGQAIVRLQSTKAESKTVSVTIGGVLITQTVSVPFTVGATHDGYISASTITPEASLTGTMVTLTINVTDASGNPVADNTPVALLSTGGVLGGSGNTVGGIVTRTLTFVGKGSVTLSFSGLTAHGDVTINFIDTTAPIIDAHGDETAEATSYSGAVVTYTNPTATDNIDGVVAVSCLPISSSTFALGNTTVTCSASDVMPNTQTSTFIVHIIDTTKPEITAPVDQTFEATGSLTAPTLTPATATDIADPSPVIIYSPHNFSVGTTTVTWTATDGSGNSQTATSLVIIIDTQVPIITPPGIQTFEATSSSTTPVLTPATATDIADPSPVIIYSPHNFSVGTTTVTWTATDGSGNFSITTSDVVITDNTAPVISLHGDEIIEATSSAGVIVTYTLPTANDLVDGPVGVSCSPLSDTQFALGDTAVTCTASDVLANTSTSTFNVHVHDTTAPSITAPADITDFVANGVNSTIPLGTPIVTDAVDSAPVITNNAPVGGFSVGTTVVTWTATDGSGNYATATQNVTVVPAPISKIVLTASSESLKFDQMALITVTGKDVYDHTVTNDNSTVIELSVISGVGNLDNTNLALSEGKMTSNLSSDAVGLVKVRASSAGLGSQEITIEFTEADILAPYVWGVFPANEAMGVAVNVQPYVLFSEPLDASTVMSENVQLKKVGGDAVPANISMDFMEGKQRVVITPNSPLANNSTYNFTVTTGITDEAGNALATDAVYTFTTVTENVVLSVLPPEMIKFTADRDNTFASGWKWRLNVTAPTDETKMQMKFTDFIGTGASTIVASDNIRFSSPQSTDPAVLFSSSSLDGNGFSLPVMNLSSDMDSSAPGRQFQIIVEVKVPSSTPGGAYSNSFDIQTSPVFN